MGVKRGAGTGKGMWRRKGGNTHIRARAHKLVAFFFLLLLLWLLVLVAYTTRAVQWHGQELAPGRGMSVVDVVADGEARTIG